MYWNFHKPEDKNCDSASRNMDELRKWSKCSLVFSIAFSLVFYLVFSLVFSIVSSLVFSLMFSLVFSLVVSLSGFLRVLWVCAQSMLRVCSECVGAWKPENLNLQRAFLPIYIVTCSSNLNCVVLLFVAFVCLLRELRALHELHWVAFCSDLEQLFWPYDTGMSENLKNSNDSWYVMMIHINQNI